MTQQQLAAALGVSRQTIISLENGKYNPSILLAHAIARLFGTQIEDIFLLRRKKHEIEGTEKIRHFVAQHRRGALSRRAAAGRRNTAATSAASAAD